MGFEPSSLPISWISLEAAQSDEAALRSVIAATGYEFLSYKSEPYQPKGLFAALKGWFS